MNELVRLYALDGTWEVGGADRRRGIWPEDLTCAWDDWGPSTASFTLKRDPGAPQPDLAGLTPVEVEKGAGLWEGFVDMSPAGDWRSLSVEAIGWPDHGSDDLEQKMYVRDSTEGFIDSRSAPGETLGAGAGYPANPTVALDSVVTMTFPTGTAAAAGNRCGAVLDLGPGQWANRVRLSVDHSNNSASFKLCLQLGDVPYSEGLTPSQYDFASLVLNTGTPNVLQVDATAGQRRRYVQVWVECTAGNTPAADVWARVTACRCFGSTAYESGGASILKASTVLADALPRLCPQWSQDVSGIDATLLSLPTFAPSEPRTFRQIVEGLNALHGYVAKLERGRRFRFKPQPTVPSVAAGDWDGVDFRDTSKNATRDIYNKAVGLGRDGQGTALQIERWAGQQPNTSGESQTARITNPSFLSSATGWTNVVRDTTVFDTSPASGRADLIANGAIAFEGALDDAPFGVFKAGTAYRLAFRARKSVAGVKVALNFGDHDTFFSPTMDYVSDDLASVPVGSFGTVTVVWVPKADIVAGSSLIQFLQQGGAAGSFWVDTFSLEVVRPTLLDRRGRVRAQSVQMPSQAVGADVLVAFADVFLQTHMRTRARGDLTVRGRAAVDFSSHDSLDPFELGDKAGELVCLLDEIDPDTGRVGRDVPIAGVTYNGNDETAQLALDDQRENFEKMVARYELLSGGGGA